MNQKHENIGERHEREQTSIGAAIKYLRKKKELSLQELADRTGCNSSYLSLIETGKRKNPTANYLLALSEALGTDLMGLYYEQPITGPSVNNELETLIFNEMITVNGRVLQAGEKVAIIEILNQIEAASWDNDIFYDSAKILNAVNDYKKIVAQIKKLA